MGPTRLVMAKSTSYATYWDPTYLKSVDPAPGIAEDKERGGEVASGDWESRLERGRSPSRGPVRSTPSSLPCTHVPVNPLEVPKRTQAPCVGSAL